MGRADSAGRDDEDTFPLPSSARQGFAALGVGRRHVKIERAQRLGSVVANLVFISMLDQQQCALAQTIPLAVDRRDARSGNDV